MNMKEVTGASESEESSLREEYSSWVVSIGSTTGKTLHVPDHAGCAACVSYRGQRLGKTAVKPIGAYPTGYWDVCAYCVSLWRRGDV